ncbi:hypothetical protein KQR54_18215 [Mycobacterium gordonae]|nr:hypothetical protein [Mycobacterium gordonae]
MKLATGIASLFLSIAAAIHAVLIIIGSAIIGDDSTKIVGYIIAVIAALLLFGGALSFQRIQIAHVLFMAVTAIGICTVVFVSLDAIYWTVGAFVLAFMSDHIEPHRIPSVPIQKPIK